MMLRIADKRILCTFDHLCNVSKHPRQQHCSSICHKEDKEITFQDHLKEGVFTRILPQEQHIVQCHHSLCAANQQKGDELVKQVDPVLGQPEKQVHPLLDSSNLDHSETVELGHNQVESASDKQGKRNRDCQGSNNQAVSIGKGTPKLNHPNCDSALLATDDSRVQQNLILQGNCIFDCCTDGKLVVKRQPKNCVSKNHCQVNQVPGECSLPGGCEELDKITLLQEQSDVDSHLDVPGSSPETSVAPEQCSGTGSHPNSSPTETDPWLDTIPDFWEEIRESPIEESCNRSSSNFEVNSGSAEYKRSSGDNFQGNHREECVNKDICDPLLSSCNCSSVQFYLNNNQVQHSHRTRRIRNSNRSTSTVPSVQGKKRTCWDIKGSRSEKVKEKQGLTFQWTDFDIDTALEFIPKSVVCDVTSSSSALSSSHQHGYLSINSTSLSSMVAKSQESGESEGKM